MKKAAKVALLSYFNFYKNILLKILTYVRSAHFNKTINKV